MRSSCISLVLTLIAGAASAATPYDDLTPGHWRVISNNTIDDVDPCPAADCAYSAVEGVSAVIDDWTGGALASGYGTLGGLVAWGGGHNGYFGSEPYVFDLGTQLWVRASEPYDNNSSSVAPDCADNGTYPDLSACAAHTYDQVDYQPTTNRFIIMSGTDDPVCGGCSDGYVHAFDFDDSTWSVGPQMPMPTYAGVTAYDPSRDVFWFLGAYGYPPLYRYDPAGNGQWTEHGNAAVPIDIDGGGVVDPVHDLFIYIDARGSGKLFAFDLKNPHAMSVELTTAGDTAIQNNGALGFEWDPVEERVVAWTDGADVYTLTPPTGDWKTATWTWTLFPPAPDNDVVPARNPNGTYSRFRHVPSVNAFVLVSSTSGPVWMIRLSDKPGTGMNPGTGGSGAGGSPSSGVGPGTTGAGGAGAAAASGTGDDAGGCGCKLSDRHGSVGIAFLAAMSVLVGAFRRRRRR